MPGPLVGQAGLHSGLVGCTTLVATKPAAVACPPMLGPMCPQSPQPIKALAQRLSKQLCNDASSKQSSSCHKCSSNIAVALLLHWPRWPAQQEPSLPCAYVAFATLSRCFRCSASWCGTFAHPSWHAHLRCSRYTGDAPTAVSSPLGLSSSPTVNMLNLLQYKSW